MLNLNVVVYDHPPIFIHSGLYFMYITGCRPNEAAYVAMTRKARRMPYTEMQKYYSHVIEMPK